MMTVDVSTRTVMRDVELSVRLTGGRATAKRLRLGVWLLKLGAVVIGCGIDIAIKPPLTDPRGFRPLMGAGWATLYRRVR